MDNRIILASASPRRKELLKQIFAEFEVVPSEIEEVIPENINIFNAPEYLALLKARDIAEKYPNCLVLGADTSVFSENVILGKPKNYEEAFYMLSSLSGKSHSVITGCAIVMGERSHSFSVQTEVRFFELSKREIEEYIATNEPFDKAGGYGIQSKGGLFVKEIIGDYFNVVGLPIAALNREIKDFLKGRF